jgi:uncharacterized protein with HEPN domain
MSTNRDLQIIKHILSHCLEIEATTKRFELTLEALSADFVFKNAVSMNILQIGELSTQLSKDFKLTNDQIPWNEIIKMRNIAVHHYLKFNIDYLFDTIIIDIPRLKIFCQKQLDKSMAQQASEVTRPKPPRP